MTDNFRNRGQKMADCARGYTAPNMQGVPIRTEEGRQIKQALRKDCPMLDVDFAEIEARILAWGVQK